MPRPFVVVPENRSRALDVVGEKITVLASGDETQGYEIFMQEGTRGTGPPPHSHDWDESFFVLDGSVRFGFDGSEMVATAGTLVHLPAGTEHWFAFDSDAGRMLSLTGTGSGAAAFFRQVDADVPDGSDLEGLAAVADRHKVRIEPPTG